MNAVSSLRFPTAFATGLLITAGLFTILSSMTDVTFDVTRIETTPIEFTRQKDDTPTQTRHEIEKPAREVLPPPVDLRPVPGSERGTVDLGIPRVAPSTGDLAQIQTNRFSGTDTDVVPVVRVPPTYPQRAANAGTEGWVQVRFDISSTGAVVNPQIVDSSPARVFDDAALKAIVRWRYNPKVDNGVAVERRGVETLLRFTLE